MRAPARTAHDVPTITALGCAAPDRPTGTINRRGVVVLTRH